MQGLGHIAPLPRLGCLMPEVMKDCQCVKFNSLSLFLPSTNPTGY